MNVLWFRGPLLVKGFHFLFILVGSKVRHWHGLHCPDLNVLKTWGATLWTARPGTPTTRKKSKTEASQNRGIEV